MVLYIDPTKEVTAMSEIVIETKQLTKQYGTQKSVYWKQQVILPQIENVRKSTRREVTDYNTVVYF